MIRKYMIFLLGLLFSMPGMTAQNKAWLDDKYSMFIHFGLYSSFGGVWDGEPVRQGYSEQIQSFAGIFSDWYAAEARTFDPVGFDADEIAALAKEGGMRSIVFTSKHHDGFCMFDTKTTSYSSVAMMPSHRDFVKEMAQACERQGLRFGLYFSLIDWNYPYAYPVSSHNADFITDEHHEFNKAQVRELLTNYGRISELWFDMGSLKPEQSRELYGLVKELQPDCMVSGRLGNDVYDFAVMADNKLPGGSLQAPWQSAASMFPETWSYRSWQERGSVEAKYAEKLRSLITVVAGGGIYLLNIGPASDGSIVPFEGEVIRRIGGWLEENGDAVYGTAPSPFNGNEGYEWGCVTVKDNVMYLLLTGEYPQSDITFISEEMPLKVEGADWESYKGSYAVHVTPEMFGRPDVEVIKVVYASPVKSDSFHYHDSFAGDELSWENSVSDCSYSCFDYYSNYRSTVGYRWDVRLKRPASALELTYTSEEIGRKVRVFIGEISLDITLDGESEMKLHTDLTLDSLNFGRMRGGIFDNAVSLDRVAEWHSVTTGPMTVDSPAFSNYLMTAKVDVHRPSKVVLDVSAGNGVEILVDGRRMMKHLNPYRTVCRNEKVLLDLDKGEHQLVLRSYNRFEDSACAGIALDENQRVYRMRVDLPEGAESKKASIRLIPLDRPSPHTDCELHNVILKLVR